MNLNEYTPREGWNEFNRKRKEAYETVALPTAILFTLLFVAFPALYTLATILEG